MYNYPPDLSGDDSSTRQSLAASECMEVLSVRYGLSLDEVITAIAAIVDQYCIMAADVKGGSDPDAKNIRRDFVNNLFVRISLMAGRPQWTLVEHDLVSKHKPTKG